LRNRALACGRAQRDDGSGCVFFVFFFFVVFFVSSSVLGTDGDGRSSHCPPTLHGGGTEHASRSERGRRGVSGGDVEGRGGIGCGDFSERIDQRKRVRLGEALSDTTRGVERGYRLVDQR
jgi:hypothetical protein